MGKNNEIPKTIAIKIEWRPVWEIFIGSQGLGVEVRTGERTCKERHTKRLGASNCNVLVSCK